MEACELGFRLVEVTEHGDPGLFGRGEGGADLLEAGAVADEGEGEVGEVLGAQEATGGKGLQPAFFFDPASDHADVDEGVRRRGSGGGEGGCGRQGAVGDDAADEGGVPGECLAKRSVGVAGVDEGVEAIEDGLSVGVLSGREEGVVAVVTFDDGEGVFGEGGAGVLGSQVEMGVDQMELVAAMEAADEGLIEAEFDVDVGPLVADELAAFVEEPVGGLIEVGGAGEGDVCEAGAHAVVREGEAGDEAADVMMGGESESEVDEEFLGPAGGKAVDGEQEAPGPVRVHAAESWE